MRVSFFKPLAGDGLEGIGCFATCNRFASFLASPGSVPVASSFRACEPLAGIRQGDVGIHAEGELFFLFCIIVFHSPVFAPVGSTSRKSPSPSNILYFFDLDLAFLTIASVRGTIGYPFHVHYSQREKLTMLASVAM